MRYLAALLSLLTFLASPVVSAECLKDGDSITLTGKISRETFPGPPNYESIDDGDEPETCWVLTIQQPRCVVAESMENGSLYEVAKSTTRFQLAFEDQSVYAKEKGLVESSAIVKGELFAAHTGHHHTKALIAIKEIKPVPKSQQ
ncbi:hypothetical protein GMST_07300 [Geomonas silvestris]|uniref:DUF4431 domain-containing protein n=1 Tax=Geomonas silvestris TaxID=2740184 RepID=A0A6V8MEI2_9BACT|nr:DUF4431 domain-containing protein [Geomonas silvestris]GFO58405.1 hypothetical protein GMST_07300 [Geomonas silvestris]